MENSTHAPKAINMIMITKKMLAVMGSGTGWKYRFMSSKTVSVSMSFKFRLRSRKTPKKEFEKDDTDCCVYLF